ncbi:replication endonuclease [Actinobacillus equuli subsp. haemolyticus]|uniref:Replication endonuclease n=1 Tax=Actinobacillus equuli subsp. equuli TaxID=202947 RepID=A0A9X4JDS4_ACTEU|nr:replication endonuclease [Actinobacillus equuli]MDE8034620.1 replication endonuclease [Actinobacillus equuli subsp. equuli]WGE63765.1 replication endonuclease [Actinobacillus equuli subsp. haemolyticus]
MNAQLFNTHDDLLAGSAWDWSAYYAREAELNDQFLQNQQEIRPLEVNPEAVKAFQKDQFLEAHKGVVTDLQIELFDLLPKNTFDYVESLIQRLPRQRQREYFRKLYLREYRSVKDDGSIGFEVGNKQRVHATTFLRDLVESRLNKVFAQYHFNLDWIQLSPKARMQWADNQAKQLKAAATIRQSALPFYLISPSKLEVFANKLADIFSMTIRDLFTECANSGKSYSDAEAEGVLIAIYGECGALCETIGFDMPYWAAFQKCGEKRKPNIKSIEIALNKISFSGFWKKLFQKAQKQMIEHLAIACGDVRKDVAPYISNHAFGEWRTQMRKNYDFLRSQILVNVDNPEEQIELFDMFLRSSTNPSLRRLEMMTRLRGVEEWAEENGYEALFLTLTAPSSFHAQHSKGGQNKKWSGASPKQTQAYLNKVWAQYRALLAKRSIDFKGMRVAEPHHDGTPHWHLLFYVKAEWIEEVTQLFKAKALELDGDEKGAEEHRCKVERCDKSKGSATAYIAKYISKNIDGFDESDSFSDEVESLSLKDNAKRVRAWASLWGFRQFQFYGTGSISVWRELRRCLAGQINDEKLEEMRLGADLGDYAFYMDKQNGGARSDAVAVIHYEQMEDGKFGEPRKRIDGLRNAAKSINDFVKTRLKRWAKVRKVADLDSAQASESEATSTERSSAWTCVNNCNPSNSKGSGIDKRLNTAEFLQKNSEAVNRLNFALKLRGIGGRWITDERKKRLILGETVSFMGNDSIRFDGVEVEII